MSFLDPRLVVGLAFLLGIALRISARGYLTPDWELFLGPWYEHARQHGFGALRDEFTNYTPFYSYLLIAAAKLDGLASPVVLVKGISHVFEFGCALVGMRLVGLVDPRPARVAFAFAALWLSPGVLHNGAFWAQCDAIWTFFVLLSVWAACLGRMRWAILAFAIAFSVKFQAIFLGPFLLGMALRRRQSLLWFSLIPLVYLALAAPALMMGRPLGGVLSVYLGQSEFYRTLWKGAANLYAFVPERFYHPGLEIGLALATVGGLALALWIARARAMTSEALLLAAAMSLALMPFLLPKMHERFFYGFDVVIVLLACLRPLYVPVAVAALFGSLLCYLPFDGYGGFGQQVAGLQMLVILLHLRQRLARAFAGRPVASDDPQVDRMGFLRPSAALWFSFLLYTGLKGTISAWFGLEAALWPKTAAEPIGLAAFLACFVLTVALLRRASPEKRLPSLAPA